MRYSISLISAACTFGLLSSADAFSPVQIPLSVNSETHLIQVQVDGPVQLNLRSASFVSAKLIARGFAISEARRQGQIYIFSTSKNGYAQLISVDARNARIVGLKVLTALAGIQLRAAESTGNRFIDESYEFGYMITEAEFAALTAFTAAELSSAEVYTVTSLSNADLVVYEPLDDVADGSDDLDMGEASDAEGNAQVQEKVEPLPDDAAIPDEPNADTIPPEPGDDEPTEEDVPPEEPPPEDVPLQ